MELLLIFGGYLAVIFAIGILVFGKQDKKIRASRLHREAAIKERLSKAEWIRKGEERKTELRQQRMDEMSARWTELARQVRRNWDSKIREMLTDLALHVSGGAGHIRFEDVSHVRAEKGTPQILGEWRLTFTMDELFLGRQDEMQYSYCIELTGDALRYRAVGDSQYQHSAVLPLDEVTQDSLGNFFSEIVVKGPSSRYSDPEVG